MPNKGAIPLKGRENVSIGTSVGKWDPITLLTKAIQETQSQEHRAAMMAAKDLIVDLRKHAADPRNITLVRERYEELLEIEQLYDNLRIRIQRSKHLRH
jgi:hypothetical protein